MITKQMKKSVKDSIIDEIHKPARKNFKRRRTVVRGLDDLWQSDLAIMTQYAKENRNFKYILVVIDCFSKYLWARALKTKTGEECSKAMADILKDRHPPPRHLQTDDGREYRNATFQALCRKHNINFYSTFSSVKAAMAERVIRTLKNDLYKAMSYRGKYKWIDILDEIVDNYNHRVHSTIRMRPADVTKGNEQQLLQTVYFKVKMGVPAKFHVGDNVRISKYKGVFDKGYHQSWTNELFTIATIQKTNPITYLLKDGQGQVIQGGFYEQELQKTKHPDVYLVEKIIRKKNKKAYVKWLGLGKEHNSWVNQTDILE